MNKRIYIITILVIIAGIVRGQSLQNVQSPNAASLGKYIETPVSYFNGTPNISIPLYEITEGEFKMPISLSYKAQAFNPNELAGWVGQDWTLNAGGAITRVVRERPDDHFYVDKAGNGGIHFYNVYEKHTDNWKVETPSHATDYDEVYDGEPDIFYFNFNGYSGKFMFNAQSVPCVFGSEGFKIEVHPTLYNEPFTREMLNASQTGFEERRWQAYSVSGFRITTPDGYKYEFGKLWDDHTRGLTAVERSRDLTGRNYEPVTNAWYLLRVTSPEKKEVARLQYDCWPSVKGLLSVSRNMSYMKLGTVHEASVGVFVKIIEPCYLKTITTANHTVSFTKSQANDLLPYYTDLYANLNGILYNYEEFEKYIRVPLWPDNTGERYANISNYHLDEIVIRSNTRVIKNWDFYYTNNKSERLRLLKLQEKYKTPYLFDYNERTNKYILGEATDRIDNQIIEYGNLNVDCWGNYTGSLPTSTAEIVESTNRPKYGEGVRNYFRYTMKTGSSLDNVSEGNLIYADDGDYWGNSHRSITKIIYPTGGHMTFEYEPHTYTKVVDRDPETWMPYLRDVEESKTGGIRIRKIQYFDANSTVPAMAKEYEYEMGIIGGMPKRYLTARCDISIPPAYYITMAVSRRKVPIGGIEVHQDTRFYSIGGSVPMSMSSSGNYIGYSKVTETESGRTNGRKEFYYSNFQDHPSLYTAEQIKRGEDKHLDHVDITLTTQNCFPRGWVPLTSYELMRGKLLSEATYNSSGKLLTKDRYYYSDFGLVDDTSYAVRGALQRFREVRSTTLAPQIGGYRQVPASVYLRYYYQYYVFYYPYLLIEKESTDYLGAEAIQTKTKFEYSLSHQENLAYIISEEKVLEDKSIVTEYFNVFEFLNRSHHKPATPDKQLYQKMHDSGLSMKMVEERVLEKKPGVGVPVYKLIGGTITKYKDFGNGNFQPYQKYSLKKESAEGYNDGASISSTGLYVLPAGYEKDHQIDSYDTHGNPLQMVGLDGTTVSYYWGYSSTHPVIKAENITYSALSIAVNSALQQLGKTTMDALLNELKLLETTAQQDLWKSFIDKVNTHSSCKTAHISFYTHSIGAGVTSISQPNGQTSYYIYDAQNWLKEVYRLEGTQKQILESYDYNYKK